MVYYSRRESLNVAPMGNELVMMDVEKGLYFGLNSLAAQVWQLLTSPISLDTLVSELMLRFDVTEDVCRIDTEAFLKAMADKQLIIVQTVA